MSARLVHVTTIPLTVTFFMKGQIPFMRAKGFETIVVSSPGRELDEIARTETIEVHAVPMERGMAPIADLVSLIRLWRLFRKIKPTIVHSSTPKAGPLGMLAAFLARVPVRIYTLRGVMIDLRSGFQRRILKLMEWIGCHCAHQVLAVSRSVAEVVIGERLCPRSRMKILGSGSSNGIDAETLFNPRSLDPANRSRMRALHHMPETAQVIGFVGRIVKGKGIVELSAAWRTLRDRHPESFLLLIGPEEAVDPVPESILTDLKTDARVVMVPFVPKPDMPSYYHIMDVVAFPSHTEGLPNVPLEAAAMELPVVASRVTGCVDVIVEGVTGTLVSPADPSSLAEALEMYLNHSQLRQQHGEAAREMVCREYRPQAIWEALYAEYIGQMQSKGFPTPETEKSARGLNLRE